MYEVNNYEKEVKEAFSKGRKPPLKLTETEIEDIIKAIKIAENR